MRNALKVEVLDGLDAVDARAVAFIEAGPEGFGLTLEQVLFELAQVWREYVGPLSGEGPVEVQWHPDAPNVFLPTYDPARVECREFVKAWDWTGALLSVEVLPGFEWAVSPDRCAYTVSTAPCNATAHCPVCGYDRGETPATTARVEWGFENCASAAAYHEAEFGVGATVRLIAEPLFPYETEHELTELATECVKRGEHERAQRILAEVDRYFHA